MHVGHHFLFWTFGLMVATISLARFWVICTEYETFEEEGYAPSKNYIPPVPLKFLNLISPFFEYYPSSHFMNTIAYYTGGYSQLREFTTKLPPLTRHPTFEPNMPVLSPPEDDASVDEALLPLAVEDCEPYWDPPPSGVRWTITDYACAYTTGLTTPSDAVRRIMRSIVASDQSRPSLNAFVETDSELVTESALASTERYQEGKPLSILDGVPFGVKDHIEAKGYHNAAGTAFWFETTSDFDSAAVGRLKKLGAIVMGKTNQTPLGLSMAGINPYHGVCRNPYNAEYTAGESSGGSGAAVGAGLVPFSLGSDFAGCIRKPAALCGVVGLVPTFGRVAGRGEQDVVWTVGHIGPLASTVRDTALVYAAIAGTDRQDVRTLNQPPPTIPNEWSTPYQKLPTLTPNEIKIGIYPEWFTETDPEVLQQTKNVLTTLQAYFQTRQKGKIKISIVNITLTHLELQQKAHKVIMLSEAFDFITKEYMEDRASFPPDLRLLMSFARYLPASDYIAAQRVRTWAIQEIQQVFSTVDLIVTPTMPRVPKNGLIKDEWLPYGVMDLEDLRILQTFLPLANFWGVPAITVPIGEMPTVEDDSDASQADVDTDANLLNLPSGIQFMASHWNEVLLFYIGDVIETKCIDKDTQIPKPVKLYSPYYNTTLGRSEMAAALQNMLQSLQDED